MSIQIVDRAESASEQSIHDQSSRSHRQQGHETAAYNTLEQETWINCTGARLSFYQTWAGDMTAPARWLMGRITMTQISKNTTRSERTLRSSLNATVCRQPTPTLLARPRAPMNLCFPVPTPDGSSKANPINHQAERQSDVFAWLYLRPY